MHLSRCVTSRVPEDRVGQENFTLQPLIYLQSTKPKPHFRQAVRQRDRKTESINSHETTHACTHHWLNYSHEHLDTNRHFHHNYATQCRKNA